MKQFKLNINASFYKTFSFRYKILCQYFTKFIKVLLVKVSDFSKDAIYEIPFTNSFFLIIFKLFHLNFPERKFSIFALVLSIIILLSNSAILDLQKMNFN